MVCTIAPDRGNGLQHTSAALCQHVRGVSPERVVAIRGIVGAIVLGQIREVIAVILDLP